MVQLLMMSEAQYEVLLEPCYEAQISFDFKIWAWERVTVLRPQVIAQRDIRNIFPAGLPKGPHATRWFARFSWTDTTKHVLKVFRDALDSMTEDQFIWEPYSDELIESLPDYCRIGRDIWRVRAPIFCWDVVEVHLPDRVMRQFGLKQMIPTPFLFDSTHFHHDRRGRPNTNWELEHAQWLPFWNQRLQYICEAPINREPLRYDDPYLIWFRRITRLVIGNPTLRPQQQQGYVPNSTAYETMKDCLTYVHEADRINVQADYRRDDIQADHLHHPIRRQGKDGVAGRRARAAERGRVPVEMDEAALEDYQATGDIGSTSRSHTQEFTPVASGMTYQPTNSEIIPYMTPQISRDPSLSSLENVFGNYRPQHFENAPNFTSSPVPMSMEIPDAMTNLEDSNIEIEGNELDDSNNEVDGNDPENASEGGEPSVKKKRTIFPKFCGTGTIF
uniref:Serine/threonine-protein phosphatase 7 long form homolog n=1 Tax=Solanum tuberosum TaxID=4113 RepID=M1CP41_SOLTU